MKFACSLLIFSLISMSFIFISDTSKAYQPSHFPQPVYNFNQNPLDSATIELGRLLFYDPILSSNNTISCASCHSPYNSFAHTDHALSHGIFDSVGNRNAPALFNLAWQRKFMWDGAINHLDAQPLAPISNKKEMGSNMADVIARIKSSEKYPALFQTIYKDADISSSRILKALSQFELTLVSADAKYDRVMQGKAVFTMQEKSGYALYKSNCARCHTEPLFTNYTFQNNGLPIDSSLNDYGRMNISLQKNDSLKFKVPSLRNLSYTYPYMHDGRFKSLNEVLAHYTQGIQKSTNSIADIKENISLTSNEKVDLIAFLLTLNDSAFVFNKSHHFKK